MELSIKQCEELQEIFSDILANGEFMHSVGYCGICFEADCMAHAKGYYFGLGVYAAMEILMSAPATMGFSIGIEPGGVLGPKRVTFLMLLTAITAEELQEMLKE